MTERKNNPAEIPEDRQIVITRVFDAPRELVWDAMTDPKQVVHWWGPRGFSTTIEVMELRPCGIWKHVMHGPDGTDYPNKSVFMEVVKPERIVYSHGGGKEGGPGVRFEATWTFDSLEDGKTRLTLRQIFPTAEDRETVVNVYGAIEGGKQTFARLAEQLARTPLIIERTFDAPIETVWAAITDKDQMVQWYFPNLDSFKPEVGFEPQFSGAPSCPNDGRVRLWKVTAVIPGKQVCYSWKYAGFPGESLVTFELFPEGGKTRLILTHEGLETFEPEVHPEFARGNWAKGWNKLVGTSLVDYIEKSAPVP